MVAVDRVENVDAACCWHLRLMQFQEVPVEEEDRQADVVREQLAVDPVEFHGAVAVGLGQEEVRMDLEVVAELGRKKVHRDLAAVPEDRPVPVEALRTVWVGRVAAQGHVKYQVEEWHAHTAQEAAIERAAWTASMDQEQKEGKHAVDQETLTGLRVVACPVDEQEAQKEVEPEREAVGASSAVLPDSARSLAAAEGEVGHSDHAHLCVAGQEQEVTQFWEKERWGRETL